jgi:hypothetical protein
MSQIPEQLTSFVWILSNVCLPLSVGTVVGLFVRPLVRCLGAFCIIGFALFSVITLLGLVNTEQLCELKKGLPFVQQAAGAAKEVALRFPAATVGLMVGVALREFWRCRIRILTK